MTRHYFDTHYAKQLVRVTLGYDRPLNSFFMQVQRLGNTDDPFIYSSAGDPEALQHDPDDFAAKLVKLGISVPSSLFEEVWTDGAERRGNRIVEHLATETRVIYEEAESSSSPRTDEAGELELMVDIANRAAALARQFDSTYPQVSALCDIARCHSSGYRLRLDELLCANDADFAHDVFGIRTHLNRRTGRLEDGFTPRFAASR